MAPAMFTKIYRGRSLVSTARLINSVFNLRRLSLSNTCTGKLINIEYSGDENVAYFSLNRPPVNSFSMDFMNEIIQGLEIVENKKCRGIIFTSDLPSVFCAGLDLKEVLQSSQDRLVEFRKTFQKMWSRIYGTHLITMAAIKGHAIAGGCVLSLACDVSVMATGYRIGLPELALGLYLSPWMSGTLINAVGFNKAEKIIYKGQIFTAEEAADIGLIYRTAPSSDVMQIVKDEMAKRLSIKDKPRTETKQLFRKDLLELLERTKEEDIEIFLSTILNESTRIQIESRIGGKQKK